MNHSEESNTILLKEYADIAGVLYTFINVSIQQYDGIWGLSSGIPTIEVQQHYIENPAKKDEFRDLIHERLKDLEQSVENIYTLIETGTLKIDATNSSTKKIADLMHSIPVARKIYFRDENPRYIKREIINIVDETIRLDKESEKMRNIFAGLNTYLDN